ncbi:hypothetical protein TRVL_03010 [Trypanosoma vivax]|nr:hypothetical protein TRVL_03010 [Trypanosoma vivax]
MWMPVLGGSLRLRGFGHVDFLLCFVRALSGKPVSVCSIAAPPPPPFFLSSLARTRCERRRLSASKTQVVFAALHRPRARRASSFSLFSTVALAHFLPFLSAIAPAIGA